ELGKTDPAIMKPGQRVLATLDLGDEKDVITVPRQAVFEKDGKKVVYRKRGKSFSPVPVTLGASAVGRVVVTSGLETGDVIAMAAPEKPVSKPAGGAASGGPALGGRA